VNARKGGRQKEGRKETGKIEKRDRETNEKNGLKRKRKQTNKRGREEQEIKKESM